MQHCLAHPAEDPLTLDVSLTRLIQCHARLTQLQSTLLSSAHRRTTALCARHRALAHSHISSSVNGPLELSAQRPVGQRTRRCDECI